MKKLVPNVQIPKSGAFCRMCRQLNRSSCPPCSLAGQSCFPQQFITPRTLQPTPVSGVHNGIANAPVAYITSIFHV